MYILSLLGSCSTQSRVLYLVVFMSHYVGVMVNTIGVQAIDYSLPDSFSDRMKSITSGQLNSIEKVEEFTCYVMPAIPVKSMVRHLSRRVPGRLWEQVEKLVLRFRDKMK